jgi:hypothetical protein
MSCILIIRLDTISGYFLSRLTEVMKMENNMQFAIINSYNALWKAIHYGTILVVLTRE